MPNLSITTYEGKDQETKNQIPHLTQDTIRESFENTRKHHKKEIHADIPFPTGDHKAARSRLDSMTDKRETQITERIHKRSSALERSIRKLLKRLNIFDGTNL